MFLINTVRDMTQFNGGTTMPRPRKDGSGPIKRHMKINPKGLLKAADKRMNRQDAMMEELFGSKPKRKSWGSQRKKMK